MKRAPKKVPKYFTFTHIKLAHKSRIYLSFSHIDYLGLVSIVLSTSFKNAIFFSIIRVNVGAWLGKNCFSRSSISVRNFLSSDWSSFDHSR
jgi:hypothetical protein